MNQDATRNATDAATPPAVGRGAYTTDMGKDKTMKNAWIVVAKYPRVERGLRAMPGPDVKRLYRRICERIYDKHYDPNGGGGFGGVDYATLLILDPGLARAYDAVVSEGRRRARLQSTNAVPRRPASNRGDWYSVFRVPSSAERKAIDDDAYRLDARLRADRTE